MSQAELGITVPSWNGALFLFRSDRLVFSPTMTNTWPKAGTPSRPVAARAGAVRVAINGIRASNGSARNLRDTGAS